MTDRGAEAPPRITYISWAESCSRSDHTARELGGRSFMVYARRFGSHPATVAFKYLAQARETLRILAGERPDAVFVMTPPVFAALPVWWFARRQAKRFVIDAHTAAFLLPRWRHFQWLQARLCRAAETTLVSNEHLATRVRERGGHATLVPDVPVLFPDARAFHRPEGLTVGAVCSFDYDEPFDEIVAAAESLPDVTFFVTGNPSKLSVVRRTTLPANLHLTGFLDTPVYGGLLRSVDAVLVLTTYDHTMLRGAYEAIYQGTPVVVSDWPLLRDAFAEGAVHVQNTAAEIAGGIRIVMADLSGYRAGAERLRASKTKRWEDTRLAILARLPHSGSTTPPQPSAHRHGGGS